MKINDWLDSQTCDHCHQSVKVLIKVTLATGDQDWEETWCLQCVQDNQNGEPPK